MSGLSRYTRLQAKLQNQALLVGDQEEIWGPDLENENTSSSENEVEMSDHNTDSEEDPDSEDEAEDSTSSTLQSLPYFLGKNKTTRWEKEPPNRSHRRSASNVFRPGASLIPRVTAEYECFKLFVDDFVFEKIVENTNSFIEHAKQKSYINNTCAYPTDIEEIEAFFGLQILFGSMKTSRTQIKHLWNSNGIGWDVCMCSMSYHRFSFLMTVIHFDDYRTRNNRKKADKFCHIREIFDHIVANFQKYYTLSEGVTIDEQLLPFRGRCSFKQYIPSKPACYGIKTFAMVDSLTFYTFNLETYLGKQPTADFEVSNKSKDVVLRLVQPIRDSGRNVTADNWFTSLDLVEELEKLKLSYVGTIRKNKPELPLEFKANRLREVNSSVFGFTKTKQNGIVTLVSYVPKKNKSVTLVSTLHDDNAIDPDSPAKKPEIITFYNEDKCGVDLVDQMCANFTCQRTTNRWPLVVFYNLVNISCINGFIIYKKNQSITGYTRFDFLQNLGRALVRRQMVKRIGIRQVRYQIRKRCAELTGTQFDEEQGQSVSWEKDIEESAQATCKICKSNGRKKNTRNRCSKCKEMSCPEHFFKICDTCADSI